MQYVWSEKSQELNDWGAKISCNFLKKIDQNHSNRYRKRVFSGSQIKGFLDYCLIKIIYGMYTRYFNTGILQTMTEWKYNNRKIISLKKLN